MSDARRFEAFVRAHQNMVYATAVRLLGRPADAEDVAQTVFLKAWERFDALAESPAAAGWLRTVATNASLNHLTRHRRRWRLFSELARDDARDAGDLAADVPASAPGVDETLAEAETLAALEAAVWHLPDAQRVPLVLFHFEQQSYQQIADRLGVSLAKVNTDIHRARLALRATLGAADAAARVGRNDAHD
jgi:RNA polymerase sigma-70 factor (ECF subfamily)